MCRWWIPNCCHSWKTPGTPRKKKPFASERETAGIRPGSRALRDGRKGGRTAVSGGHGADRDPVVKIGGPVGNIPGDTAFTVAGMVLVDPPDGPPAASPRSQRRSGRRPADDGVPPGEIRPVFILESLSGNQPHKRFSRSLHCGQSGGGMRGDMLRDRFGDDRRVRVSCRQPAGARRQAAWIFRRGHQLDVAFDVPQNPAAICSPGPLPRFRGFPFSRVGKETGRGPLSKGGAGEASDACSARPGR
jgi:hypothetical protein